MIRNKTESQERVIDLDGPEGNAFSLLGNAQSWFRQIGDENLMGIHGKTGAELMADMQSSDYNHLLTVFHKCFKNLVVLETENEELINLLS